MRRDTASIFTNFKLRSNSKIFIKFAAYYTEHVYTKFCIIRPVKCVIIGRGRVNMLSSSVQSAIYAYFGAVAV